MSFSADDANCQAHLGSAEVRPERFAKDRVGLIPKLAYLPFGGGPRACIGKTFAMMEARLVLATLAQRHRLSLVHGQSLDVKTRITLTPKRGMPMTVSPRAQA